MTNLELIGSIVLIVALIALVVTVAIAFSASSNPDYAQYLVEVVNDNDDLPITYQVHAPDPDIALLLAFAMDGGLDCGMEDWDECVELAKSYATIIDI